MDMNLEQARLEHEMGRTLDLSQLNEALCNAQAVMNVESDSQGNRKNKYVSIKELINSTQQHLRANGLILTQVFNKYEGESCLEALLHHRKSNQWIRSRIPLVVVQAATANEIGQGIGCIITYFRRYTYSSMLGLRIDEEDLDDQPMQKQERLQESNDISRSPFISDKQLGLLKFELKGKEVLEKVICEEYKIKNLSFLPKEAMNEVLAVLKGK